MKIQELKQEDINEYVATTKDFWDYSKIALKSPFSFWKDLANYSIPEVINAFSDNNVNGASGHFNILFGVPLIKGEFPCVYGNKSGVIITNYRYFANSKDGLVIIPFHTIKNIGNESAQSNDGFEKAVNKIFGEDKELVINYSRNGIDFKHKNPEFVEFLQNAYNHKEYSGLTEIQKVIIENTYYDFEKFNSILVLPKIDWQSSLDYAKELKKTISIIDNENVKQTRDTTENRTLNQEEEIGTITKKSSNIISKIIVFGVLALIVILLFKFCGGDSCKGHESDIKNGQIRKAEKMGMTVNNISVKYIGDCEYKCVSDIYDPGTALSTPQRINSTVIYKWNGSDYSFVRNE